MIKRLRFSALTVALAYIAVSLAVLAVFATPIWYAWREIIEERRTELLQEDTRRLATVLQNQGPEAVIAAIGTRVEGQHAGDEKIIVFADASLSRLAGNLPAWPAGIPESTGTYTLPIEWGGHPIRAVLIRSKLPGGYNLLVGRNTARYKMVETLFLSGLAGATGAILLLGILGGWLIRRALLSKVHGISQTASAIVGGNLSRRLPTRGTADELDMLAQTVNRMLDQIEHLIDGIRNVSNAIAHDLRTPLAELRSRLEELALTRPGPEQTFAEIDGAMADVDRVIGIFNALLRLAEIDAGTRRSGFIEVDAARIASEAAEFYQPVAELHGVALSFASSGPLALAGDPVLLAQAIGNLIDNALKYAQKNGAITVEATRCPGGAIEIAVADDGPGISDEEKPKVLERFYRGDASRGTPGAGLGLSLVAAVARLHGGALKLTDNHPGLRGTLIFVSSANSSGGPAAAGTETARSMPQVRSAS